MFVFIYFRFRLNWICFLSVCSLRFRSVAFDIVLNGAPCAAFLWYQLVDICLHALTFQRYRYLAIHLQLSLQLPNQINNSENFCFLYTKQTICMKSIVNHFTYRTKSLNQMELTTSKRKRHQCLNAAGPVICKLLDFDIFIDVPIYVWPCFSFVSFKLWFLFPFMFACTIVYSSIPNFHHIRWKLDWYLTTLLDICR